MQLYIFLGPFEFNFGRIIALSKTTKSQIFRRCSHAGALDSITLMASNKLFFSKKTASVIPIHEVCNIFIELTYW